MGVFYKEVGDFTWKGVSDCEEIVGVTHRRWWGVGLLSYTIRRKNEGDYWE